MSYIGNQPITAAFLTDTFSGNGSTVAFTMTVAPANTSSIIVAVTGVLQDPSTYSVSGTTLTFSAAPPSGTSNISVRYLGIPASGVTTTAYRTVTNTTATAGQTTFTIPSYTVGYVDVYRNGVYLPTTDYTATTGTTVVLNNAATAGDTITTVSFYVSSVLNAIPNSPASVNTSNIVAGAVGTTQLASGSVTQSILGTGVAGTGPAFLAYANASQSITHNTATKVAYQVEAFDTANCFDSTTNYRFTPNVAGYYQVTAGIYWNAVLGGELYLLLYKNGSSYIRLNDLQATSGTAQPYSFNGSTLVYLNGSTDYIEVYTIQTSGSTKTTNNQSVGDTIGPTNFQAFLARSA